MHSINPHPLTKLTKLHLYVSIQNNYPTHRRGIQQGDGKCTEQQSKLGFDVCTNLRTLSCRAETEEERDAWVEELRRPLNEDETNDFLKCVYGKDEEMSRLTSAIRNSYSAPVQQKERMKSHRATKMLQ
jgi:hypothetical protein